MSEPPVVLVFDIDGTLLHSVTAHQSALLEAYRALGVEIGDRPLGQFPDHTDSAIFELLFEESRGERAAAADFVQLDMILDGEYLRRVTATTPQEIPGARALIHALTSDTRFRVTFATGSMRGVATQKLAQLGVDADAAILVTASEFLTREEIVAGAIELAASDLDSPLRVIVIGDGIWDQRAAERLGVSFLAVESGTHRFNDGPIQIVSDLRSVTPDGLIELVQRSGASFSLLQPNNSKE